MFLEADVLELRDRLRSLEAQNHALLTLLVKKGVVSGPEDESFLREQAASRLRHGDRGPHGSSDDGN